MFLKTQNRTLHDSTRTFYVQKVLKKEHQTLSLNDQEAESAVTSSSVLSSRDSQRLRDPGEREVH